MLVPLYLGFFFNRGAEKQPDTPRHISKKKRPGCKLTLQHMKK